MVKITDFSNELLRMIWDFVATRDIDNFSFVCQKIHHAGLAHINNYWQHEKKYAITPVRLAPANSALSRKGHIVSVPLLDKAEKIRMVPVRGGHVRELIVSRHHSPAIKEQEPLPECSEEYLDSLKGMMNQCIWRGAHNQPRPDLEDQFTQEWERGIRHAGDTFLLTYLLFVCPLELLRIGIQCASIRFILDALRSTPYKPEECTLNTIQSLEVNVMYEWGSPADRITFDDLIALAKIPSLTSIYCRNESPANDSNHELFKEPIDSNVTELFLIYGTESDLAISRFISAFDHLESFTIKANPENVVGAQGFSEERIMSVLRSRSEHTLTSLTIHNRRLQRNWMGSIKEFTLLEYLSTDWRCLIDESDSSELYLPDYLPPSLETLFLKLERDFEFKTELDHVRRLVAAKTTTHRALKHFELLRAKFPAFRRLYDSCMIHEAWKLGLKIECDVSTNLNYLDFSGPVPRLRCRAE